MLAFKFETNSTKYSQHNLSDNGRSDFYFLCDCFICFDYLNNVKTISWKKTLWIVIIKEQYLSFIVENPEKHKKYGKV